MNEIGEILKEARIEKGYTLDDLQQITKIQKRYLEAIEDGNSDILPGRFYARAFIKQYADIVDLDGEALLEENMNQTSKEASEEFAESVNVAPTRRTPEKHGGFFDDLNQNLPTILIFLLVAAILVVIYFAWTNTDSTPIINDNGNTEQVEPPVTDETNDDVADEADDQANSDETETEEEPADETEEEEPEAGQEIAIANSSGASTTYEVTGTAPEEQTVQLTANGGDSWVSISVVGGAEEAALLSDGQSLNVTFGPETSEVNIVVGNASVTEVSVNDTTLEYAPEAAGIVRQDLTVQFTE